MDNSLDYELEKTQAIVESMIAEKKPSDEKIQVGELIVQGITHPIYEGENKIGRNDATCSIVLRNKEISSEHAVITVAERFHFIGDLYSRNCTYIEQVRIKPFCHYQLVDGAVIKFAHITATYRIIANTNERSRAVPFNRTSDDVDVPETPILHSSAMLKGVNIMESSTELSIIECSQPVRQEDKLSHVECCKKLFEPCGSSDIDKNTKNKIKESILPIKNQFHTHSRSVTNVFDVCTQLDDCVASNSSTAFRCRSSPEKNPNTTIVGQCGNETAHGPPTPSLDVNSTEAQVSTAQLVHSDSDTDPEEVFNTQSFHNRGTSEHTSPTGSVVKTCDNTDISKGKVSIINSNNSTQLEKGNATERNTVSESDLQTENVSKFISAGANNDDDPWNASTQVLQKITQKNSTKSNQSCIKDMHLSSSIDDSKNIESDIDDSIGGIWDAPTQIIDKQSPLFASNITSYHDKTNTLESTDQTSLYTDLSNIPTQRIGKVDPCTDLSDIPTQRIGKVDPCTDLSDIPTQRIEKVVLCTDISNLSQMSTKVLHHTLVSDKAIPTLQSEKIVCHLTESHSNLCVTTGNETMRENTENVKDVTHEPTSSETKDVAGMESNLDTEDSLDFDISQALTQKFPDSLEGAKESPQKRMKKMSGRKCSPRSNLRKENMIDKETLLLESDVPSNEDVTAAPSPVIHISKKSTDKRTVLKPLRAKRSPKLTWKARENLEAGTQPVHAKKKASKGKDDMGENLNVIDQSDLRKSTNEAISNASASKGVKLSCQRTDENFSCVMTRCISSTLPQTNEQTGPLRDELNEPSCSYDKRQNLNEGSELIRDKAANKNRKHSLEENEKIQYAKKGKKELLEKEIDSSIGQSNENLKRPRRSSRKSVKKRTHQDEEHNRAPSNLQCVSEDHLLSSPVNDTSKHNIKTKVKRSDKGEPEENIGKTTSNIEKACKDKGQVNDSKVPEEIPSVNIVQKQASSLCNIGEVVQGQKKIKQPTGKYIRPLPETEQSQDDNQTSKRRMLSPDSPGKHRDWKRLKQQTDEQNESVCGEQQSESASTVSKHHSVPSYTFRRGKDSKNVGQQVDEQNKFASGAQQSEPGSTVSEQCSLTSDTFRRGRYRKKVEQQADEQNKSILGDQQSGSDSVVSKRLSSDSSRRGRSKTKVEQQADEQSEGDSTMLEQYSISPATSKRGRDRKQKKQDGEELNKSVSDEQQLEGDSIASDQHSLPSVFSKRVTHRKLKQITNLQDNIPVDGQQPGKQHSSSKQDSPSSDKPAQKRNTRSDFQLQEQTHVMFTGLQCSLKEVNVVAALGGVIVESPSSCTVLVTDKVRRTFKFLCVMGLGKPIVSLEWLQKSQQAGYFLDPWKFLLKDVESEVKFSFCLQQSLKKASQQQLLSDYSILLTRNIKPPSQEMKGIIESCGGKILTRMPRGQWPEKSFSISCVEDKAQWNKLKKGGKEVVAAEMLLLGVLQQKLDIEGHLLR